MNFYTTSNKNQSVTWNNNSEYDVENLLKNQSTNNPQDIEKRLSEARDKLTNVSSIPPALVSKDHANLLKTVVHLDEAIKRYQELSKMIEHQLLKEKNPVIISKKRQELEALKNQQLKAMDEYKTNYDKLTRLNFAAQKVKHSMMVSGKISQNVLEKTVEQKGYVNVDYYTLKRLAQNDQVTYKNLLQKNAYLRYITTILCFIVLVYVVGSLGYISFEITLYTNFSFILLGICILLYTYYSHLNDDSLSVYEKNFQNTGAMDGLSTVTPTCVPSAEDMWESFFDIKS
jgi:hypothetical protein